MPPLPEANEVTAPPPTWRIPLGLIDPNPFQPRREMDERALSELRDSVRNHGLLQPITVRRKPGGRFEVIGGGRRREVFLRLLKESAGDADATERYSAIPAHEKFDVNDELMALYALIENLQRDDLSPLDAALGLAKFQATHQLSTDALCQRTGLELDRAKRLLRLSRAPAVVQEACDKGVLVEVTDGKSARLLPSGNPKHERVRLDLMPALEFSRFHAAVVKSSPKKADDRTARAIQRALSERWNFKRIQTFCRAAVAGGDGAGTAPKDGAADGDEKTREFAPPPVRPLFTDGEELRIRHSRVRTAPPEQRQALRERLKTVLEQLA